jgi:hypothetical protein
MMDNPLLLIAGLAAYLGLVLLLHWLYSFLD